MLHPVYKNVMSKQNPFEIVFKDICKFDAQNPITDSFLSETESGKLTDESVKKFLYKAQNPKNIELNQKLQSLKLFNRNFPDEDDDDNDGGLPPSSSTIPPLTPPAPSPPPLSVFNGSFFAWCNLKISQLQNESTTKQQHL